MKIGVRDTGLPDAALEQILIGARLVGLTVFLAEYIAIRVIARILLLYGHLNGMIVQKVLIQPVHNEYRSAGAVRLCGAHCFHAGGGLHGVVKVTQAVPSLANFERAAIHVHVLPAQTTQLPHPQPGEQIKNDAKGGRLRRSAGSQNQPGLLLPVQHPHLMLFRFREPYPFHQIFRQQLILHRLPEGQVHHVAQVRQRFGGKPAFSSQIPLFPSLVEKVLQVLAGHGTHITAADLGLDMASNELFIAAIGG